MTNLKPFEHLTTQIKHTGKVLELRSDLVVTDRNREVDYEYVAYPNVVVVLGITSHQELVMIRQYRPAIRQFLLELPAGKMDPGEDPLNAAKREFEEETGYIAKKWNRIAEFYSAPGFCTEYLYLYLAQELSQTETHFDEDENIETELIPISRLDSLLSDLQVVDAKSLIGVYWAKTNIK